MEDFKRTLDGGTHADAETRDIGINEAAGRGEGLITFPREPAFFTAGFVRAHEEMAL